MSQKGQAPSQNGNSAAGIRQSGCAFDVRSMRKTSFLHNGHALASSPRPSSPFPTTSSTIANPLPSTQPLPCRCRRPQAPGPITITMPLSGRARTDGDKERSSKNQEQELKRARGAISCAECRRLKLKCDKTVPCSSCKRRGCASICPNGSLTTGQGTRYASSSTSLRVRKSGPLAQMYRLASTWQQQDIWAADWWRGPGGGARRAPMCSRRGDHGGR